LPDVNTYWILHLTPMLLGLLVAATIDFRSRRIPNWLNLALAVSGLFSAMLPGSPIVLPYALAGLAVGFMIPFILFALGALGGGDVKLLASIGCWLGPIGVIKVFLAAALVGLVIVLVQAIHQKRLHALFRNSAVLTMHMVHLDSVGMDNLTETGKASRSVDRPLPYAVPVLIGTLILLAI
jgi:prepilin peptidase CpaA